jgi:transmembrane sensor
VAKLGDYLDDSPDAARLERQWGRVAARIEAPRAPRFVIALAAAAAMALPAAWWWSHHHAPHAPETAAVSTRAMELSDGSKVQLSTEARLDVEQDTPASVALKLVQGRGDFSVTHDASRPFVVRAGGVEVRVVGTRFSVTMGPQAAPNPRPAEPADHVTVRVQEGVVEVRVLGKSDVRRLRAGEEASFDSVSPTPTTTATASVTSQSPEPSTTAIPSATASATAAVVPAPTSEAASEDAKQLFERAAEARRRGDLRRAADAYQELLTRFPRDSRAGIAAFDLARLRMDSFGDVAGAIPLLERAAAHGAGSIREDALARLVRAYQASGSTKACQRAKAAYLASFPGGVHAAAVSASCP